MLVHRGISALIGSALWDTLAMINRSYSCGLVWTGMQIPCCFFNILWFPCWLLLKLNASLTIIVNQHITRFDRKMHVLLRLWVTGWRQYPYIMYYHDSCNNSCTICVLFKPTEFHLSVISCPVVFRSHFQLRLLVVTPSNTLIIWY